MQRLVRARTLVTAVALILVGGLVANAMEDEGPNHQNELHHCVVCCATHHVAATVTQVTPQPILPEASLPMSETFLPYQQIVVRLPDPPPKFLV